MKIIATILATAIVSAAVSYIAFSTNSKVEIKQESEVKEDRSKQEIAKLQRKLREAEAEAGRVDVVETLVVVPGASNQTPEDVLDFLSKVTLETSDRRNGNTDEHRTQVRQVIREFEELTSMGPKALPAIKRFLDQGKDLQFLENTDEIVSGNWSQGRIYLDPIFPPSLRVGLFNTVRHIAKRNGEELTEAEGVLLGVLQTTGRAMEVAYIQRALDDLSMDKHKDAYLQAARELLLEPIREEGRETPWIDRQNRQILWDMLRRNKDTTFVDQAKRQMLRDRKRMEKQKDGQEVEVAYTEIDRSVLSYLTGVLGEKAMPLIRDVYEDPELSDRNRSTLRGAASNYMGINDDANIIINGRMNEGFALLASLDDKKKEKENRGRGMRTVSYYLNKMGEGRSVEPETLQARQQYLDSLRAQTQDKEVLKMMDNTERRLKDMADPAKAKKLDSRFDSRRSSSQKR